ncbi:aldehyde dehydrogenase family protein [Rhodobacteraceae bacterium MCCB 386]|nr:aldehyde dehydrogenase family protein [Roseitranquillus sediminis]MBM9592988.1 aldehyde dehydrogenase family protein [Roseitranquillus sediminis]
MAILDSTIGNAWRTSARSLKSINLANGSVPAEVAVAVSEAAGIFGSGEQSCIAGSRIMVARSFFDQFVDVVVAMVAHSVPGNLEDETAVLVPMARFKHRDAVALARDEGAEVRTGGRSLHAEGLAEGACYGPTILTGLWSDSRAAQEEILGSAALALPFEDEADLIAHANATDLGLAAGSGRATAARSGASRARARRERSGSTPGSKAPSRRPWAASSGAGSTVRRGWRACAPVASEGTCSGSSTERRRNERE